MKPFYTFVTLALIVCFPCVLSAQGRASLLEQRIQFAVEDASLSNTQLTKPDAYGTPLIFKLARKGDVRALAQAVQRATSGEFLTMQDTYGNNLFHVAKDAPTILAIASGIRQFYGTKAPQQIATLVNQRNHISQTPLIAQVSAGHSDTFELLYPYSQLSQKSKFAKARLSRLQGSDETLVAQNRAIYCREIRQLASANGKTLLQIAQEQVSYRPYMAPVAQKIRERVYCLADD